MDLQLTTPNRPASPPTSMAAIVDRTKSLYTLPAVAMEVVQLTSNPQVDTTALKNCIENDPALTAKILKVVNSSLFGLSREVKDLNQALALLGTKPLKLLVLGFSLPEELFAGVAREQLTWYWKSSLVRAVAARELCQKYWHKDGDEAFLAGLLQDIGVLVLLDQLRVPYAQFLNRVLENRTNLGEKEVQSLGFDHQGLTAALLQRWNLPELLVQAISSDHRGLAVIKKGDPVADLAKILHLAGLLGELVGQNRIQALPELLSAGETYCGFDKEALHELLPPLQEKVEQLADVLSLDLEQNTSYDQIVKQAHQEMSLICESVTGHLNQLAETSEPEYDEVLAAALELQDAASELIVPVDGDEAAQEPTSAAEPSPTSHAEPHRLANSGAAPNALGHEERSDYPKQLTLAVGSCRSRRCPLSIMLIDLESGEELSPEHWERLEYQLQGACGELDQVQIVKLAPQKWLLLLPNYERHLAVRAANQLIDVLEKSAYELAGGGESFLSISVGVSSVTLPPKNFYPPDLLQAAERCLTAAQSSDANVVKSIELL